MTSKRCFSKVLKEDFRHKVWMLVLSVLGNVLALPVAFLIYTGDRRYYDSAIDIGSLTYQSQAIVRFFKTTMIATGGIIAVAGALIVGLFGFRYVFHRNMTDTWHSMPVRRRTLFAAGWLNGFLIWFLPFGVCVIITLVLGESRLSALRKSAEALTLDAAGRERLGSWTTGGEMILDALLSVLALATAFLLVYHLVLLAVMLCGNVLNTLVTTAVLGAGAVSLYGIFFLYCESYLDTFFGDMTHIQEAIYASPLVSAVGILFQRAEHYSGFGRSAVLNLLIAAAMGALALLVYVRRPSELAEQGIANKPVRFLVQIITSFAAVLGGWLIFYFITVSMVGRETGLVWGVFGGLLVGIMVLGVMDIIFHMDFKAFFAHKALMAAVMASGLLVCLAFCFDWLGYDSYVPQEEDIAEIAIYDYNRSNMGYMGLGIEEEEYPINQVHITDSEAAHAFLEAAADLAENGIPEEFADRGGALYSEPVSAKVTLKSGRSYYRSYRICSYNNEAAYKLLTSPEYLDVNFRISNKMKEDIARFTVIRDSLNHDLDMETEEKRREIIDAICDAYNRDLEENPDAFIRGDGRLLAQIRLYSSVSYRALYLDIYEGMSNTREALRQCGLGEYAEPMEAEDVQELRLSLQYWYTDIDEDESLVELARQVYGVYPQGQTADESISDSQDISRTEDIMVSTREEEIVLCITEPEEIEELLELISFSSPRYWDGVFRPAPVESITILDKDNWERNAWIPEGALPEKYILRFGELQ